MKYYNVYTDGSCLYGDKLVHGGIVFVNTDTNEVSSTIHVQSSIKDFVDMYSVGGEILAAWCAVMAVVSSVKEANETDGLETYKMTLTYDNQGVGEWLKGTWKRKKKCTNWYVESVRGLLSTVPNLELELQWVRGHRGNRFNEIVDSVANYNAAERYRGCSVCDMDEVLEELYKV